MSFVDCASIDILLTLYDCMVSLTVGCFLLDLSSLVVCVSFCPYARFSICLVFWHPCCPFYLVSVVVLVTFLGLIV